MDENIRVARNRLEAERQAASEKASGLGHQLHSWSEPPSQGLVVRTACRACGRPLQVKVLPSGLFMPERVERSPWLDRNVSCRP